MKCKYCGSIIQEKINKTIKIKEFNLEVTYPEEYTGKYNDIKVPKGFRKPFVWELWRILTSKYRDKFLGDFKGKNNWFACEQEECDKKQNYSRWLVLGNYLGLDSYWGSLDDSDLCGRVVFCRDLKKVQRK